MEKRRNLYRGMKHLDYENPFSDKEKSMEKIKEHMRVAKGEKRKLKKCCTNN